MKILLTFFGLAYIISWTIWLPLYSPLFGISLPVLPYQHALGGLGPMMAAFITTGIYYKKDGVVDLLSRCAQLKPVKYLVLALIGPFVLILIASGISHLLNGVPVNLNEIFSNKEFPEFTLFSFFLYNLFFFGFGEETGWRGLVLPILQKNFNALVSTVVLTIFWALWHLPLFFYRPGYTAMQEAGIAGWFFSLLTGSVLLTWLNNSTKGSILICAVFHATIDIVFTSDIADKGMTNYLGFLITLWGILTIFFFKPRNLASVQRIVNE